MTLERILLNRALLTLRCAAPECRMETNLDAAFFASRYGLAATLADLEKHLVCAGCGSAAVRLLANPNANVQYE
jgi:hypothetical protein